MNSLPNNAIDTLNIKVDLADQDWSTVPSTPKFGDQERDLFSIDSFSIETKKSMPCKSYNNKPRLTVASKKKKAKLMAHGLPEQIATDLCVLSLTDILEKIPSLKVDYPNIPSEQILKQVLQSLQTPAVNAPVTQIGTDKTSPIDTAHLRVGIQNSEPLTKGQMTEVHRYLILAIAEQWNDGGGPEFLEFKHMDGWIMVTCVDHRSKAWLIDELQYLEPWPESQLSIMPERKLPKLNFAKVIAFIPGSEAISIQEALELLNAQNKGLNTEQWKLVDGKLESGKSWTVTFMIDEASLKTLEAQEWRAAIGFTTMNFETVPVSDISIKSEISGTSQKSCSSDMPPIAFIKHMLQDAKDRIEEIKQKRLSGRRVRWGRWDEPPSVLEQQRMLEGENVCSKEEPSTSATTQVFSAPSVTVIQQNFPALPASANFGGISAHTSGRNPHMVPHSQEIPGFSAANAAGLGRIETGVTVTVPQQNSFSFTAGSEIGTNLGAFSAQVTGRSPNIVPHSQEIPGFSAANAAGLGRIETGVTVTVPQQNSFSFTAGSEIGTNLGAFSAQVIGRSPNIVPHSMEIPGFGVPNATTLSGIGTGGVRISQQKDFTAGSEIGTNLNAFSAQATGRNPNMVPHSMEIPGFGVPNAPTLSGIGTGGVRIPQQKGFTAGSEIGTNLNAFSAQVAGRDLTMMSPNTIIPGFGVPNAATLGGSGIGGIAGTQQNVFTGPASQTQGMDYFLGPGGGSQFVQNQMMSQNFVNYDGLPLGQNMSTGAGDAAYQQNIALATMYPYSNPSYYMNCYQDSQAAMSMLSQDSGQQGLVAHLSRNNNGSERSKDSSQTRENSGEGYKSWIIEEKKRFESNLEDHSSLASTGALPPSPPPPPTPSPPPPPIITNCCAPMDQDPDRGPPYDQDSRETYQGMHSRSYKERPYPQVRDRDSPNHRRRSYDRDSTSRFDRRQSLQARGDRDSNIEDYESYKRSQSIREIKEEQVSPSHGLACSSARDSISRFDRRQSPQAKSDRDSNIEDYESYKISQSIREIKEEQGSPSHELTYSSDRDSISRFDRRQSPQAKSDRVSNIEDYESYKRSQNIREIKEEQVSPTHEFRSPERRSGCRHQNTADSESYESSWRSTEKRSDRDVPSRSNTGSRQPRRDGDREIMEAIWSSMKERCDQGRTLTPDKRSPQPRMDYGPWNVEGSESKTNERTRGSKEETHDLNRSVKSERISPQPMKDYRLRNIEDSETIESNRSSREEEETDDLNRSLKSERLSPQPMKDYRLRNIGDSKTNERSRISREEKDLDRSLRPDRKTPQPMKDYRPRNNGDYETNEKSRWIGQERDLDRSLKPDRKSPTPRIDYTPHNIESSETNQISQSNREERGVSDKSLKPDSRSPQPKRDYTSCNIEGSETNKMSQSKMVERDVLDKSFVVCDRIRPRLNRSPPPRSGFRRENIQDMRREGPRTWNRGVQRPRERDGHVRDRSPLPSRSSAEPREIQRPDMRPRW